jgi:hypothetical protein
VRIGGARYQSVYGNQIVQEFAQALSQNDSNLSGRVVFKALRGKAALTICAMHNK